jgi:hypothetical protein
MCCACLKNIIHSEDKVAAWTNLNNLEKKGVVSQVLRNAGINFHSSYREKLGEKLHYTYIDCLISYTLDRWEVLNKGLH